MPFHQSNGFFPDRRVDRMIAEHSNWLTRALLSRRRYPRIPVRKVSEGGFARLTATPDGRRFADRWWLGTLEKFD